MGAELENHLGISEKTLAEFIIELASGKASQREFQKALIANHAEMPDSLVQTIWNVIQRLTQVRFVSHQTYGRLPGCSDLLLTFIRCEQASNPKTNGSNAASKLSSASGLALQDSKERAKQLDEELIAEGLAKRQQSEQHASTSEATMSHRSAGTHSRQDENGRPGHDRDSPDRDRHWDRDRKRQHRSHSRDRHGHSKRRHSDSPEDTGRHRGRGRDRDGDAGRDRKGPSGNRPPPAPLIDKPEKGGVYKGSVSNVLDFGCFVELQGFKSRQEGLVHITNLSKTRYGTKSLVLPCHCANGCLLPKGLASLIYVDCTGKCIITLLLCGSQATSFCHALHKAEDGRKATISILSVQATCVSFQRQGCCPCGCYTQVTNHWYTPQ